LPRRAGQCQDRNQAGCRQAPVAGPEAFGCAGEHGLDLVDGGRPVPDGRFTGAPQRSKRFDQPVAALWRCGRTAAHHRFGRAVGVQGIGLGQPPLLPVGPVDFHDGEPAGRQHAGDLGAIASGAFDANGQDVPGTVEKFHDPPVPGGGCGESLITQGPAVFVNDGHVMGIGMSIDAGIHIRLYRLHEEQRTFRSVVVRGRACPSVSSLSGR
jgi:hypothetical protein